MKNLSNSNIKIKSSIKSPNIESAYNATTGVSQANLASHLASIIPAHLLDDGEQIILAIKPSMWLIVFNSAKLIGLIVFIIAGMRFFHIELGYNIQQRIYQFAAALIICQLIIAFLQWMSRLYVLTDRRIIRIRGVFNVDVFEAPLDKIQNTFLTLAIHERLFGLGSIHFTTAGTAGVEATWQNINRPLEIHEIIRNAIRKFRQRSVNTL